MNTSAKGRRNEYRSRRWLEAHGFHVVRAAASKGLFDLVAIGASCIELIQCKSNALPSPAERQAMLALAVPGNCRKRIHIWRDRQRAPDVREL